MKRNMKNPRAQANIMFACQYIADDYVDSMTRKGLSLNEIANILTRAEHKEEYDRLLSRKEKLIEECKKQFGNDKVYQEFEKWLSSQDIQSLTKVLNSTFKSPQPYEGQSGIGETDIRDIVAGLIDSWKSGSTTTAVMDKISLYWRYRNDADNTETTGYTKPYPYKDDLLETRCLQEFNNDRELYEAFEMWLFTLDMQQLDEVVSSFPDEIVPWIPENIWLVLKRLCKRSNPSPVFKRLCVEWIVLILKEFERRLNRDDRLCIVLDTNIILDMTSKYRQKHAIVHEIAKEIKKLIDMGRCSVYIMDITIDEMKRLMTALGDDITKLFINKIYFKSIDPEEIKKIDNIQLEFLDGAGSPSFMDFCDRKTMQVINGLGLDATIMKSEMSIRKVNETVNHIRNHSPYMRSASSDRHDVELLLHVDKKQKSKDEYWVLWTHHTDLTDIAKQMRIDKNIICYGPVLFSILLKIAGNKDISGSEMKKIMRSYIMSGQYIPDEYNVVRYLRILNKYFRVHSGKDAPLMDLNREKGVSQPDRDNVSFYSQDEVVTDSSSFRRRIAYIPKSFFRCGTANDEWLDLTLDWGKASGGHTVAPPDSKTDEKAGKIWDIGIHGVTHIDLPWAIDFSKVGINKLKAHYLPDFNDRRAQSYKRALLKTNVYEVIMLDFTGLRSKIVKYLTSTDLSMYESKGDMKLRQELSSDQLSGLIVSLAIEKNDILDKIAGRKELLLNRLLLIHTGWNEAFMPAKDLSKPIWELSHPVLVHPYLTGQAVELIKNVGVKGLAIDCPTIDCPAYMSGSFGGEKERKACEKVFENYFDSNCSVQGYRLDPKNMPAHTGMLCSGKLFYECLYIPDSISGWYNGNPYLHTNIMVNSLYADILMDGALCKIMIMRPEGIYDNP